MELNISSKIFLIILFSLSFFLILVLKAFPDAGLRDDLNVTLLSPENNKVVNINDINFTFEVEWNESIVIKNCTLFGNFTGEWAANETNQTEIVEGENGIYLENLEDGTYEWNVYCFNETQVYDYAESNFTLIVDAVSPFYLTSCFNLDQEGATYYLTADILDSAQSYCMNISANNVTLDCQGHTIDGDDNANYGIYLYRTSLTNTNVTIKNCIVTGWNSAGIYLYNANNNILENLNINSNPSDGIQLDLSSNNQIFNSTSNNNYHGIYLSSSSNNQIFNSSLSENSYSDFYIYAYSDTDCNNYLSNITGSGNKEIKYFNYSVTLSNEVLSELILCNADYSNITNITIDASQNLNNNMLLLTRTDYSNLTSINSSFNYHGIYLFSSSNNQIFNSMIQSSLIDGIYLYNSVNNKIYNNLFNNTNNFYFSGTIYPNYWNTTKQAGSRIYSKGLEIGGNYWTNSSGNGYSDTCSDSNKDGFCDSPYILDLGIGNNTDYYPLSNKYQIYCGNGYCETGETCSSCPRDCGTCPGGGAGPGPGAGAPLTTVSTTPGKAVIFIPLIAAMSKANVSIQKTEGIDFTQIVISVRNRVTSVQINITKLDEKPEEVPALANVYRYIRVDKKNIHDENITEVKLRFRVQKSWINSNNIKVDSIALYRYTYRWEKLNTLRIGEDSEDIYFEASSPGLSYFAIAGEKSKQTCPYECCIGEAEYYDKACASGYKCENHACVPIVTPCTEDWVCSEWTACIGGKQTRVCMDRNRCGTVANKPEEERICEEKPEEKKLPILVFWLGIIVVILAIFIITKIIAKKLQTKVEEKPKPEEKPKVELKKKPKKKR